MIRPPRCWAFRTPGSPGGIGIRHTRFPPVGCPHPDIVPGGVRPNIGFVLPRLGERRAHARAELFANCRARRAGTTRQPEVGSAFAIAVQPPSPWEQPGAGSRTAWQTKQITRRGWGGGGVPRMKGGQRGAGSRRARSFTYLRKSCPQFPFHCTSVILPMCLSISFFFTIVGRST